MRFLPMMIAESCYLSRVFAALPQDQRDWCAAAHCRKFVLDGLAKLRYTLAQMSLSTEERKPARDYSARRRA